MVQITSLRDLATKVIATEIERTPGDYYVKQLCSIELEFLKLIFKKLSYITLEKFLKSGLYKDAISYGLIKNSMKETEDHYRHLFATDRNNPELNDPHLMLVDVFENKQAFDFHPLEPEESQIPRVFPLEKKPTSGPAIVQSEDEFKRRFSLFTEGQLEGLNWSNVFVAGGSVLASISQTDCGSSKHELRNYFHRKEKYCASDIDLFIYGLNPEQATEKLNEIFEVIQENNPNELLCVRTPQCVSIVSQFPYRHIQVILRLYKSPAEILMGFDLDCVTIGFDGSKVYALPRFHRAITRQYNLVDLSRRSTTYEARLFKYSKRGFEVAVPNLDRKKLNASLSAPVPKTYKLSGLAKLIDLETTEKNRYRYKMNIAASRDNQMSIEKEGEKLSDYSVAFLPWGPSWSAVRIRSYLGQFDNSRFYNEVEKSNYQSGKTIKDILKCDDYRRKNEMDVDDDNIDPQVLPLTIKWLTVDPGRQYIGSFHPEDPNTWFDQAYTVEPIVNSQAKATRYRHRKPKWFF